MIGNDKTSNAKISFLILFTNVNTVFLEQEVPIFFCKSVSNYKLIFCVVLLLPKLSKLKTHEVIVKF